MWQIRERKNGEWSSKSPEVQIAEGRPPILETHITELEKLLNSVETEAPLDLIKSYISGGSVVAGDAIDVWGESAAESWLLPSDREEVEPERHSIRFVDGHRLEWRVSDKFVSTAWHDETIVMVPLRAGVDAIEIVYRPSEKSLHQLFSPWSLAPRYKANRDSATQRIHFPHRHLDLRVFMGKNSIAQDGLIAGSKVVLQKSANATGVLIGKVVNLISRRPWRIRRDPLWARRITEYENRFPRIRQVFPDLRSLPGTTATPSAIVAVHGMFSCGINIVRHFENPQPKSFMYRFEHDTFVNVTKNAEDLVNLVCQKLETSKLLLVAHSRGGLVARMAAAKLQGIGAVSDIEVWTYGTPHKGTPLVFAGQRTLGALYNLGRVAVGSIPVAWYAQAAMRFLVARGELPQGVQDLEPGRSFLDSLDLSTARCTVVSHAGDFDPNTSAASGYGVIFLKSLGQAAFNEKNDLVVPTNSAEAAGTAHRIKDCDHFNYFERRALQNPIIKWPAP